MAAIRLHTPATNMKDQVHPQAELPAITPREVELHKRIARLQREQLETEAELRRIRNLLSEAYSDKLTLLSKVRP